MRVLAMLPVLFVAAITGMPSDVAAQCQPRPPLFSYGIAGPTPGSSGSDGVMFDIQNTSGTEIRITGFEQTVNTFGTYDFEIYTKVGSYARFESTPSAWTLVGSASGVQVPISGSIVPIPAVLSVAIPPYGIQGFYITTPGTGTSSIVSVNSFAGATTASDGVVNIVCGVGKQYPFSYTLNGLVRGAGAFAGLGRDRCWRGRVSYCRLTGTTASNTVLGSGCLGTAPLTLTPTSLPRVNSNWSHALSNLPPNGVVGVEIVGLTDPGLSDLTFVGLPGCGLRASLDRSTVFAVTGPTHIQSIYLPNSSALVGTSLFATAAVFQNPPVNPFGAITANGVQGVIGNQ
jgi:hypothetical protein